MKIILVCWSKFKANVNRMAAQLFLGGVENFLIYIQFFSIFVFWSKKYFRTQTSPHWHMRLTNFEKPNQNKTKIQSERMRGIKKKVNT